MLYLNQTFELLTGGFFIGDNAWNKSRTEIDNCFKLYQLEKGEVTIYTNNETHLLQANKLYFLNGFKIKKQSCHDHFKTYWLHFIPNDLIIYHMLQSLPTIVDLSEYGLRLDQPYSIGLLSDYEKCSSDNLMFNLHFQNLLGQVTLNLLSSYSQAEQETSSALLKIRPAIQYINNNYKDTIKLEELGKVCFLSANHFHKLFKQYLNITPANYQMVLKMNAALQMLGSTDQPIKNIAINLGFVDNAHFTRTFKTHYGISPKAFRMKKDKTIDLGQKENPLKSTKIFC